MPVMLLVLTQGQFVFGYAKPVPINPYNFRNPTRDMAISAAAGPGANILLAVASVLLLKMIVVPLSNALPGAVLTPVYLMLKSSIIINVVLASFNLLPVPPLDGGRIVAGFLPKDMADKYGRIEPYGMIIVIVLIMTGIAGLIIKPLMYLLLILLNLL
jgi:Zn-dependent protease